MRQLKNGYAVTIFVHDPKERQFDDRGFFVDGTLKRSFQILE
jgi:hypothetical protein